MTPAKPDPMSRRACRPEHIEVGEEPTTCTHCGSRTEWHGATDEGQRLETCTGCGQRFLVTDAEDDGEEPFDADNPGEIEVVDDAGNVVGTTETAGMMSMDLDQLLAKLQGKDTFEPSEMTLKEQGAPRYKVGDRVIWTNEYGVCWGEKTITEVLEPDRSGHRYMITPHEAHWMYVREAQLAPAPQSAYGDQFGCF